MYPMYVYYIFRLYKYTMYVYYVRVCAAIVQIFNFLDIHSKEYFSYFTQWMREIGRSKIFYSFFKKIHIQVYRPLHFGSENDASP